MEKMCALQGPQSCGCKNNGLEGGLNGKGGMVALQHQLLMENICFFPQPLERFSWETGTRCYRSKPGCSLSRVLRQYFESVEKSLKKIV